jgi:replicative DNA helicase
MMIVENQNTNRISQRQPTAYSGLGKLPPQAIEMEEVVLGALMIDKHAIVSVVDKIKPEIFYKDSHCKIYAAILRLYSKSRPIDIRTVTAELRSSGELEMIGGAYYITELTNPVTSSENIEYHAAIVYQKYLQREMIRISTETINAAYEDTSDVFEVIDKNTSETSALLSNLHGADMVDVADMVTAEVTNLYEKPISGLLGVGTGFTKLDEITNGFRQPDLILIAARPSMGKTAFMLNCARNASLDYDKPGLIFSLEMSKEQLTQRLIAAETGILLDKIIKRNLDDYETERLGTATERLQINKKMFIDDTAAIPILELRAKAKRAKMKHNIQWVMVDYLQLMKGSLGKNALREQEVASISSGLKGLAKELQIPVIALSQLSRAVESQAGSKKPNLSHLRESGSLEQDADLVLFLYRAEYYGLTEDENGTPTAGIGEVIIAKHRNGVCGEVKLKFNGALMKFKDLDESQYLEQEKPKEFNNHSNFIIRPSEEDWDDQPF